MAQPIQQVFLWEPNTNVAAIASGTNHDVALFGNGTVISWGLNNFAQTNVPPGLSNVIAIAAGDNHSAALLNNGMITTRGDDTKGQTNIPQSNPTNPVNVKLLAAVATTRWLEYGHLGCNIPSMWQRTCF